MNQFNRISPIDAIHSAEDTIRRLEALVPTFRERGTEADTRRELSEDTLADLVEAGVFRAMRPKSAGGLGCTLQEFTKIVRVASRGDGSVGWLTGLYTAHAWQLSMLGKEAQDIIFAEGPTVLAAEVVSAPGTIEQVEGGYRLTGRWTFASGSLHADYIILMAFLNGVPIGCIIPVADVVIHDTWHVAGLRATGSNDVEVSGIFVPELMTIPIQILGGFVVPGAEIHDYQLLRYPTPRVLPVIHAAVGLGVADAAIELYKESIQGRVRLADRKKVSELATTHELFAQACHERRCSELLLRDAVDILDAAYGEGAPRTMTPEQRANLNLANAGAAQRAFTAIDIIIQNAGASIHRTGHPLDRICRDTQVMRNHTLVDWKYHCTTSGNVLLGNDPDPDDRQF